MKDFARVRLARLLSKANAEKKHVLEEPDADAIHDLRVSLRRLEQGLALFGKYLPDRTASRGERVMKRWLKGAGRVRNYDIAMELLDASWRQQLEEYRATAAADLVALLRIDVMPQVPADGSAASPSDEMEVIEFARKRLPKFAAKFFATGREAALHVRSLHKLHQFRLQGKEIRYRLEIFEDLYGPKIDELMKLLKRVQQDLGEMSDSDATARIMAGLGANEMLVAALNDRARDRQAMFAERWMKLVPDEATVLRWVRYLELYAGRGKKPAGG